MSTTARILAQGDEIVTGATVDTNSAWIAAELWQLGVRVIGIAAAPDDRSLLAALLREAGRDCDLVVSSGGLGPTLDDVTAEAVAEAVGQPLELRDEALAQIRARFAQIARPMASTNDKQALLPRGAELLENDAGTAPGFALTLGASRAFFFPGVPRELRAMATRHLLPWVRARGEPRMLRRRLHVCGVGESVLQQRLADLELPAGVRLGFKTWLPYNSIVLYGQDVAGGAEALAALSAEVRRRLGDDVFGTDDSTLPAVVGERLRARGLTVGLAESCTAGGAAAMLTEVAGSSDWFVGGVVSYANDVKVGLLGVPTLVLDEHGAVSEPCAAAMAQGVRTAVGSDVGVSITGVAGPGGGSEDKPVGTVCLGLALPGQTHTRTVRFGAVERARVRSLAAATALDWLRRKLG